MKIKLFGLCVALALLTGPALKADDDHKQGGHISGNQNLQVLIRFVATSNAPAGARGTLRLKSHNHEGTNQTQMKITTTGLAAGTYDLSATLKSDGSTVALGQITLAPEDEDDDNSKSVLHSESEVELPADVSAMDIATVTISDGTGALLIGDITNAPGNSVAVFNARVRVTSDDPNVRGTAVLHSMAHKGKRNGNFNMVVHGLAANTTYHVVVNGTEVATVRSGKKGAVMVRKLKNVDFSTITSVQLQDDTAAVVAEAAF